MIQFNKTIFQFAKRLALVVMLIGVSNAMWAAGLGLEFYQSYYYSRVGAQATLNGNTVSAKNLVYVSEIQTSEPNWEETNDPKQSLHTDETDNAKKNSTNQTWQLVEGAKEKFQEGYTYYTLDQDWNVVMEEKTMSHSYYLYAQKVSGYLFAGWYNGDNLLKAATEYTDNVTFYEYIPSAINPVKTLTRHETTGGGFLGWGAKYTFTFDNPNNFDLMATAKYLVPAVVSVENQQSAVMTYTKNITHTDPSKTSITVPVEFGVQNALAKENFKLTCTGAIIPNDNWSYADNKITINVPIELGSTGNTQVTVKLKSKYDGDLGEGKAAEYTCIINVTTDYTPRFHVSKDSKVFRSQDEISIVDEFIATSLNDAAKHTSTIWTTGITGTDASCFTFVSNAGGATSENTLNPRIQFPHFDGDNPKNEYNAELHIYCTYNTIKSEIIDATGKVIKDANGNVAQEKVIYLSARFDPIILFDEEENKVLPLTTLTATAEDESVSVDIPYRHNLTPSDTNPKKGEVTASPANTCITFGDLPIAQSGNITVSENKNTNPGTYTATLPVSGIADDNTSVSATLTARVRIELATPSFSATPGDDNVEFSWNAIPHANKYVITEVTVNGPEWTDEELIGAEYNKSNFVCNFSGYPNNYTQEIVDQLSSNSTNYKSTKVGNGNTYYYCITALYINSEGIVVDSKTSSVISFMPNDIQLTITLSTSALNIYTGTREGDPDDETQFPLRKKRQVNVSAAFDDKGEALFNRLIIFGETTQNNEQSTPLTDKPTNLNNVKTLCYIYDRLNSTTYEYRKTTSNLNGDSKDAALTINAGDGMKYYFTGYCPFATTGSLYNEQGVIQIIGNGQVDIYLDNLQLYSRNKSDKYFEITVASQPQFIEKVSSNYASYPMGSGSVFVFTPLTTSTFKPCVHIKNENILDATSGLKIKKGSDPITFNPAIPDAGLNQYSAPIQILPQTIGTYNDNNAGANSQTELTIDDIWPVQDGTTRTNGTLSLQEHKGGIGNDWTETNTAPSIDLGLASSQLTFNGGQITMSSVGQMVASRIESSLTMTVEEQNQTVTKITTFYGVACNNEAYSKDNKVFIKDGTFNNGAGEGNALVFPTTTTVDGGTFNCNITAIDAPTYPQEEGGYSILKNKDGKALKYFDDIVVSAWDNTNANGTANMTRFNEMMDYLFPHAGVNDNEGYHRSLSMYYVEGKTYGHESLMPKNGKIRMLLPSLPKDNIKFAWQICSPDFTANINGNPRSLGGAIDNINSCGLPEHASYTYTIDYLLYMEMDEYTRSVAQKGHAMAPIPGYNIQVNITNNDLHQSINDNDNYDIEKKVYMLKPVVAGEWTMFVAPFNVTNVYVIEAYPDAQIQKDYGKPLGYGDYIIERHNVEEARQAQAQRMLDLYTIWYLAETDMKDASDFFGPGTYTDENGQEVEDEYGVFVDAWMLYEQTRGMNGAVPAEGSDYTPIIEPLYHYTGNNGSYPAGMRWWDAHYYLYKSNDKKWQYTTPEGATEPKLVTDWEIVKTQSIPRGTGEGNVIMTKGEIYTMQFPSAINSTPQDWNYWTGKYILLEGNGQELNGSDLAATVVTPAENEACVIGNASFANIEVSRTNQLFQLNKNANNVYNFDLVGEAIAQISVKPTSGYMLANIPITTTQETNEEGQIVETQKIAKSISMETGEVTYEIKTKIIDNNPGLGSGIPTIMNGMTLIVEPTSEGLTITPIKEQHVMLFDANGKMIFSKHLSAEENVTLPTGVYVVRGEYEQVKAIKK